MLYSLHPFTVHFPIALLLTSGILTLRAVQRGDSALDTSAYHCLWIGWMGSLLATCTGAIDAFQQLVGPAAPRDPTLVGWVNAHTIVGMEQCTTDMMQQIAVMLPAARC